MKRKLLIMLIAIACIFCIVFAFSACETTNFKSSIDNNGASAIKPDTEEHVHIEVIDEAVAPTCTTYGLTEGKHCSVCGAVLVAQTLVDKVDHRLVIVPAVPATCTSFGWTEGINCTTCGTVIKPRTQISMTAHIEVTDAATPATCAEFGLSDGKHCAACGLVTVPQIKTSKLAHTEVTDKAVEPTCSQFGYTEGSHCDVCETVLVEQKKIDKLPHTVVLDEAVEATCENSGLTEGSHCSVCGEIIVAQEQIPALAHTYGTDNFCDNCGHDGLKYELNEDGTGYVVSSVPAICNAKTIYIAEYHLGLPVTEIKRDAFYFFDYMHFGLERVIIPDTVTKIGACAFFACTSLTDINLPENLEYIGGNAFYYNAFTEITIPANVTYLGGSVFYNCKNLKTVVFECNLESIGGAPFYGCNNLESVILPENLSEISSGAFAFCYNFESITLGSNIKTIGINAFYNCTSLKEIVIPASVTSISERAFENCTALERIIFEDTEGWNCYDSECVTKTFSAKELSDAAQNAKYLTETYLRYTWENTDETFPDPHKHSLGDDNICDECGRDILEYTLNADGTGYEVSATYLKDGDKYFRDTAKTIYIAEMHKGLPITSIAVRAFKDFDNLENVYIPNTVEIIGEAAFMHCDSLKYIDLPENLLIDSQAFAYSGLVEVTIPASTISVGNNAFIYCRSLEKVTIGGGNITFANNTFAACPNLTTINLEEGLTTLGSGMFGACRMIEQVTIPASVYSIGRNAFTSLNTENVIFENPEGWNAYNPSGDTKIFTAEELSDPATAAKLLSYTYRYYTWWKIEGGIPDIPNHEHVYTWEVVADFICPAPYGMKEGNCTCGASVISIIATVHVYNEDGICEGCGRNMIEYTLNDEGTGYILSKVDISLTEVIIPATYNDLPVVEIGKFAFGGCYSLVSVSIPDSVTTISYGAFYACPALTEIDLNNVTTIGSMAFYYCTELKTVNLQKVTSLGYNIFQRCENLEKVIYNGTMEEWKAIPKEHGVNDSETIGDYIVYCTDGQLNKSDF